MQKQKSQIWPRLTKWLFLVLSLTCASYCLGQSPNGELVGLVQDSTGGRLPGVTVLVEALEFPLARTTTSNRVGEFRLGPLPPVNDRVRFDLAGWTSEVYPQVEISVGTPRDLAVVLKLQSVK